MSSSPPMLRPAALFACPARPTIPPGWRARRARVSKTRLLPAMCNPTRKHAQQRWGALLTGASASPQGDERRPALRAQLPRRCPPPRELSILEAAAVR
eukprot:2612168-Prymnesium_polylepis.1